MKRNNTCPVCRQPIIHNDRLKQYQDILNRVDNSALAIAIDVGISSESRQRMIQNLEELSLL